jgi:hypothetical protein
LSRKPSGCSLAHREFTSTRRLGYNPASSTGIVIMRRLLGNGQLVGSVRASRLRP